MFKELHLADWGEGSPIADNCVRVARHTANKQPNEDRYYRQATKAKYVKMTQTTMSTVTAEFRSC